MYSRGSKPYKCKLFLLFYVQVIVMNVVAVSDRICSMLLFPIVERREYYNIQAQKPSDKKIG